VRHEHDHHAATNVGMQRRRNAESQNASGPPAPSALKPALYRTHCPARCTLLGSFRRAYHRCGRTASGTASTQRLPARNPYFTWQRIVPWSTMHQAVP
jgi:hypothetical protein